MLRAFRVPAAWPKAASVILLCAPPPAVASRKLAWLKMLNAAASNFKFTRSVNLKVFDNVISAYHWPGPSKVLRPRLPSQPRQVGAVSTGRLAKLAAPDQPCSQSSRLKLLKPETLPLGRSFLPPSKFYFP